MLYYLSSAPADIQRNEVVMYRSFVFPWKEMILVSAPGEFLRLKSPGNTNAAVIIQATKTETKWDYGVVTASRAYPEAGEWILGEDILRVTAFAGDPARPVFTTGDERLIELLTRLGANEVEFERTHEVRIVETIQVDGELAGWTDLLINRHPMIGIVR